MLLHLCRVELSTTSLEVPQEGQILLLFKLLDKLLLASSCFQLLLFPFLSFLKVSGLTFPGKPSLQAHGNLQYEVHVFLEHQKAPEQCRAKLKHRDC